MQRSASPSQQPLLTEELPSWDQLRKEARTLEGEIEIKLANLQKMGLSTGLDNTGQEAETDDLIKKVGLVQFLPPPPKPPLSSFIIVTNRYSPDG